ncbi:unnamed protein product [Rotaria sordida]|uniref:SPRY domain-containing protein n=1 Tax=Rotaria sordida TaxID=392033 RepID=A0A819JHG6_9BILA|nr:unnamed protein product [Rotaria sordida]CAF3933233.1 unnamed protein product [Rotaria sordida]
MHSLTETITRTAIDISGRVGSLYDGWRDQILGTLDINTMKTSTIRSRSLLCKVQKYDMNKSPNLAQMIGIEDELRLSTLVNFVPKIGLSSIIDYPYSINKYTRCFRYHYLDRKEHLFNDQNQIEKWNKTSMPDNSATHMITEISFGIDIVVILQLPPHDKLVNDIDTALEKIQHHLQNSLENMIIASDVERLFDQILFTTVYSNIPKLVQIEKFLDLCHNLNQLKKNPTDCELLKYRLTPIKWFFLEYTGDVTQYFPLESEFRDIFENDLLQSSIVLKQACSRLDENTRRFLQKHLALQLLEVHQLYSQGKIYHEDVIQRLQSLIITIRSGQEIDVDIGQIFRNEPHLQAKADMISELQRQEFEYCNAADCGIQDGDDQTIIEQKLTQYKPSPQSGKVVVVQDGPYNYTEVRGKNEYTTGHRTLCFKIEQLNGWSLFGIISKSSPLQEHSYSSPSCYGWYNGDYFVYRNGQSVGGQGHDAVENDIVNLTIDCDHRLIRLINERTNRTLELLVDIDKCPFPWQLHLNLNLAPTRIRILS